MKKFKILFLLLLLLGGSNTLAQDGLALIRTGHGAKQTGFGEAVVSIPNQVNGTSYNPATINHIKKFTASFGHTQYWDNINLESAFFAAPLSSKINLHGGIRFAVVDELERRSLTPSEKPIELFDFHDISLKTGISYLASEKLTVGFAFGYFFEKNDIWTGSAFNADFGLQYQASKNIQLGASATNLGSSFQLSASGETKSNAISLPTRYAFGGNYRFDKYITAVDIVNVDDDMKVHVGSEANIHEMFDVRAGYMFNYDSKDFSAGVSFTKRNIKIDYAYVPYSNDLGNTHLFNFTFSI